MGMISGWEALERLRDGNRRFVSGSQRIQTLSNPTRRSELAAGQRPLAVVLGCSDSRVPPEVVFDQGLGDLFVIRVAGNIVDLPQIGSAEFAVKQFDTPLMIVLGHTQCGAILATLEELQRPRHDLSENLRSIIESIRPSVAPVLGEELSANPEALMRQAVLANVRASAGRLRQASRAIAQRVQEGALLIVGAVYSLETGVVEFLDDVLERGG